MTESLKMKKSKQQKLALVSVSDKTGLAPFCRKLKSYGYDLVSTGGTLKFLKKNKIAVRSISELTEFPEILDGRVKTLHPKVHGGLLYRRKDAGHKKQAKEQGILPIDLVVVNLYPFKEVVSRPNVKFQDAIENIDIGGPSMLRSAAKNFESVSVVTDPEDYPCVLEEMKKGKGTLSLETRKQLARKVFQLTSQYDALIGNYLTQTAGETLPDVINLSFNKAGDLRYGENPHQKAAVYKSNGTAQAGLPEQLHGKALSYNNLLDTNAAISILREFDEPAACVIKHNNPCGIAQAKTLDEAISDAISGDPISAFGGIVGLNKKCDAKTATILLEQLNFFEVLIAPSYEAAALKKLKTRKNLRILTVDLGLGMQDYVYRLEENALLLQQTNPPIDKGILKNLKWATKEEGSKEDLEDLIFAWKCAKQVKSNAIVLTQGTKTVGIGAGQMSRVDSVRIACEKAGDRAWGSVLASDAFFPMADNIEIARKNGIRLIIQPGGSIRDPEVIQACDDCGIAMCFTGQRHFRH